MFTYKGFKTIADTPIEVVYDLKLQVVSYFFLLYKSTYPFPMYAKVDSNLKDILEVYPYMIANTKEKSLALLDEKQTILYPSLEAPYYFSYDLKTKDYDDDYLKLNNTLTKVRNMQIVSIYDYKKSKEEINQIRNKKIKKFAQQMNADYACLYEQYPKKKATKFFLGYSPYSDAWKDKMNLLEEYIL